MKKLFLLLGICALLSVPRNVAAQAVQIGQQMNASTATAAAGFAIPTTYYHQISWTLVGPAPTACTITIDSAPDDSTWTTGGIIPAQTCTSSGVSPMVNSAAAWARINLSTFTGSGKIFISYVGYSSGPAGVVMSGAAAPTGTCTSGALYTITGTGVLYSCNNGAWLAAASGAFNPASPGPIGVTTPSTGAFTTITSTGGYTGPGSAAQIQQNLGGTANTIWNAAYDTPFSGGYMTPATMDFVGLTHLIIDGGAAQSSGSITACTGFTTGLAAKIAAAHAGGVKVLYGVGDCGSGYDFADAITNHLALLTTNIMSTVTTYGFDGVDVDFETGYTQPLMASLLGSLRTALGSMLLSAEALDQDNSDWAMTGMVANVDRINLLTYGATGTGTSNGYFNDGIYCDAAAYWCIHKAVTQFITASPITAAKINVGIPLYGNLYTGNSIAGPRQPKGTTITQENFNALQSGFSSCFTTVNGGDIIGGQFDPQAHAPWVACSGGYINYENTQSITDKADYVFKMGLGGWFTWNLQTDYIAAQVPLHPLQNALKLAYLGYLNNPQPSSLTGIQSQGQVGGTHLPPGNAISVTSDFTTANNTNLQPIINSTGTGLIWFTPSFGNTSVKFACDIGYSQATGNAAVAFGIQQEISNTTPANIFAVGHEQITVGPPSTAVDGVLTGLNTTTATTIVSGTPGATATKYSVHLGGTVELPAPAGSSFNNTYAIGQIQIMVSTATGADAVTVYRGSQCTLGQ